MANRGFVFNNSVDSVNLFPWVHYETIQRGSPWRLWRHEIAFRCSSNGTDLAPIR